jgi:hypothetical protein
MTAMGTAVALVGGLLARRQYVPVERMTRGRLAAAEIERAGTQYGRTVVRFRPRPSTPRRSTLVERAPGLSWELFTRGRKDVGYQRLVGGLPVRPDAFVTLLTHAVAQA